MLPSSREDELELERILKIFAALLRQETSTQRARLGWPRGLGRHESRQHQASEDRFALHNEIDLAGSEGFEWHESRYTSPQLDPLVFQLFPSP